MSHGTLLSYLCKLHRKAPCHAMDLASVNYENNNSTRDACITADIFKSCSGDLIVV